MIPGHRYALANFEDPEKSQEIQFIHREEGQLVGSLTTVSDGTTSEEVLAMLLDRLRFLNAKLPSRESALAITHCEIAESFLERRTKDRRKRGVEGTYQK